MIRLLALLRVVENVMPSETKIRRLPFFQVGFTILRIFQLGNMQESLELG